MSRVDAGTEWVTVPREVAEKHPLYGLGGWMILVLLRCASIPFTIGPSLFHYANAIDPSNLSEPVQAVTLLEFALRMSVVLLALVSLFLAVARHRAFPAVYIVYISGLTVMTVFAIVARIYFLPEANDRLTTGALQAFGAIAGGIVWILYATRSRRVNVTYRLRVQAQDPLLQKSIAEIF